MPLRIYDISKKLGLDNKVILAKAKALGIAAAKVPSSSLDRVSADFLEEELLKDLGIQPKRGIVSMGLANFKAFAETQNIPIRPLTLIFGANSSGKSSVIHGMLLAREAVASGKVDIFKTDVGGDSVDLGGFRQYVHRRRVAQRVEWSAELETRKLQGNAYAVLNKTPRFKVSLFFGMPLDDKGNPQINQSPRLVSYDIEAGGRLILRLNKRDDGSIQILRFEQDAFGPIVWAILSAGTTTSWASSSGEDRATIDKTISAVWPELRFECIGLLPERLVGQTPGTSSLPQLMAIPRSDRQKQLADVTRMFFPRAILEVIKGVNDEVRSHLEKLVYLGPLRSYPPRHLAFLEDNDRNWYAGGGFAWDLVRTDSKLRESVNQWLGSPDRLKTPYRLEIEKYYSGYEIQTSLGQGFNKVAADVVARILGDKKSDDEETAKLLEMRDEIEKERFQLEKHLQSIQQQTKETDDGITKQKLMLESLVSRMDQTRIQLQLASQTTGTSTAAATSSKEGIEASLKSLNEVLDVCKDMLDDFQNDKEKLLVDELKTAEKLKDLQRKKNEVFSEITANIDSEQFVRWLYEEIQSRPERTAVDELVLRDCRTDTRVSHRDVGIGVSQVLPVLVQAYANKEKIVAIEQPEIHLHPALQAELGDLFIESALGEQQNTFLLETHSEHLILRILRRIRETTEKCLPDGKKPIRPDDVTVVFVEPTSKGSIIKHMTVTPDGDFAEPWPGGFFAERLEDLP